MSLSRADVEKVALLARLRFSDAEAEKMTEQLAKVVDFFQLLDELDTSNVQPMAHAVELHNVLVEDCLRPSLPRELALSNAPKHDNECYRVPAVLGE